MDLSTTYLGLSLPHPVMVGASPICDDLDLVKRAQDAGAAAIVMYSLFEEQLLGELASVDALEMHGDAFAEAAGLSPHPGDFVLGPDGYLKQIDRIKASTGLPVMGSLNGVSGVGWVEYARQIAEAGADALELNLYAVGHEPTRSAADVEEESLAIVRSVAEAIHIPVSVKLSSSYTALTHFALRLREAGARGLVLFNRFYQPDVDLEALDVALSLNLSHPSELRLRLRWLALLSPRLPDVSLAVTGGVHTGQDALKSVMTGASGVQMVSQLLRHGPEHIRTVVGEMASWLEEHEYESLEQARGSLNLSRTPSPEAYERGNYVKLLLLGPGQALGQQ